MAVHRTDNFVVLKRIQRSIHIQLLQTSDKRQSNTYPVRWRRLQQFVLLKRRCVTIISNKLVRVTEQFAKHVPGCTGIGSKSCTQQWNSGVQPKSVDAMPRLRVPRVAFKVLRGDLCNLFRARNCRVKLANSPGAESGARVNKLRVPVSYHPHATRWRYDGLLIPGSERRLTMQLNSLMRSISWIPSIPVPRKSHVSNLDVSCASH